MANARGILGGSVIGAPQRHHRVLSDVTARLFNISEYQFGARRSPGPELSSRLYTCTVYWNFPPFGAQGEFSRAINRIRQIALNSNSPKLPFGMILIGGPRIRLRLQINPQKSNVKCQPVTCQEWYRIPVLVERRRAAPDCSRYPQGTGTVYSCSAWAQSPRRFAWWRPPRAMRRRELRACPLACGSCELDVCASSPRLNGGTCAQGRESATCKTSDRSRGSRRATGRPCGRCGARVLR